MTEEEFSEKLPLVLVWMQRLLDEHAAEARSVASLKFSRLPLYFSAEVLGTAKVIYVPQPPAPPLSQWGINEFLEFEKMECAGITYLDTFFSRNEMRGNEAHHLHELVHVIQWRVLGPRGFLMAYAEGLSQSGYHGCPLEVMAYALEGVFRCSDAPFDVEQVVREETRRIYS
jgi:hypothetical protein